MKVVMIEDNLGDILLTQDTFEELGIDIDLTTFNDGESGMRYFKELSKKNLSKNSPDLVILDINLPQKTGIEILQFIRNEISDPNFKVVFLTSSNANQDVREIKRLNADAHFLKPLDSDEFLEFYEKMKDEAFRIKQ
ncbi:response regulator [Algoriphagus sp. NBT04N3]|jgi:CheY-like chemotaxis protein|uniref:response regulator n=1 Tax=Algoriphagus sp. NBT04N3 TaxID=2705473 RepID=UPI001C6350E0|nr:response regulator [Algoriphagus sp. NBT04N3]QYH38931.1 response regulator [Algoriphagus sp. NBT04N3]